MVVVAACATEGTLDPERTQTAITAIAPPMPITIFRMKGASLAVPARAVPAQLNGWCAEGKDRLRVCALSVVELPG